MNRPTEVPSRMCLYLFVCLPCYIALTISQLDSVSQSETRGDYGVVERVARIQIEVTF